MARCARSLLLAVTAMTFACPNPRESHTEPPSAPTVAEIVEWFLGPQVRAPEISDRGSSVGLLTVRREAASAGEGTPRPETCTEGLAAFIPTPARSGDEWFGLSESGQLLHFTRGAWSPLGVQADPPAFSRLIAIEDRGSTLDVLVQKANDTEQLWLLTISGEEITGIRSIERGELHDRKSNSERFDSGQCVDGDKDCLRLTGDETYVLSLEPEPGANWATVMELGKDGARDHRYADTEGTMIDVLTHRACTGARGSGQDRDPQSGPSMEPEAVP